MNRKSLAALAIAAAASGAALADDITIDTQPFTSTATRAEVKAELAQARAAGVNPWSTQYNPLKGFQSTRTRAEVTAEYLASRSRVAAFTGEDSGAAYLAQNRGHGVGPTVAGR